MFPQLTQRMVMGGIPIGTAISTLLASDPLDLILYRDQIMDATNPLGVPTGPAAAPTGPAGRARRQLFMSGEYSIYPPTVAPAFDHLGFAYAIENTRLVQIMRRVVHAFRTGEALGVPSAQTIRWLDATEGLLFGAENPIAAWLATSSLRPDAEAVRRNAYQRMFGMDLAFGTDDNRPYGYVKAAAANTPFVPLFEELLYELWQAISNLTNSSGATPADDDRIYRTAEQLRFMLRSRRQNGSLATEELVAVTMTSWLELTINSNTSVVNDLRAQGSSASDRLRLIGDRVGLPPHSRTSALLSLAEPLSTLLRLLEGDFITGPEWAWLLYRTDLVPGSFTIPTGLTGRTTAFGPDSRRVITEWSAATGRDIKARKLPVAISPRQLTGQR